MTNQLYKVMAIILFAVSISGCSANPPRTACEADNLLLEISSFPGELWQETGSRDVRGAPSRLGIERAGTSFSTQSQGGVVHDYYLFATESEAEKNYAMLQSDWFKLDAKDSTSVVTEALNSVELRADKYRLGCAQDVIETCRFVALYRTYVVEFKADMLALRHDDFVSLLEQIDQKMMRCVGD
jgi:hypothetical protein